MAVLPGSPARHVRRPRGSVGGRRQERLSGGQTKSDDTTRKHEGESSDDDEQSLAEEATSLAESAAEIGFGAVIAPFTGGETVPIVASMAGMLEAGFDRLTHLGEHESEPDDGEDDGAEPGEDGEPARPAPDAKPPERHRGDRRDDGRE